MRSTHLATWALALCFLCTTTAFNVTTVPPVKLTFGSTGSIGVPTTEKSSPGSSEVAPTGTPDPDESDESKEEEEDNDSYHNDELEEEEGPGVGYERISYVGPRPRPRPRPKRPQKGPSKKVEVEEKEEVDGDQDKDGSGSQEHFDPGFGPHGPHHGGPLYGPPKIGIGFNTKLPKGPLSHIHFASLLDILRKKGYSLIHTFKHFSFLPVGLAFVLVYFVLPVVILVQYFSNTATPTINIYTGENANSGSVTTAEASSNMADGWYPTMEEAAAQATSSNTQGAQVSGDQGSSGSQDQQQVVSGWTSYGEPPQGKSADQRRDFAVAKFDRLILESEQCLERINCELLRTQKITDSAQKVERWFTNSVKKSGKRDFLEDRIKVSARDILKPCINYTCEKLSSVRRVFKWYN